MSILRACFLLYLAGLLIQPSAVLAAEATWLQLCGPDAPGEASSRLPEHLTREYLQIDGERRWLALVSQPDSACERVRLPLGSDKVRWFGLIPEAKAERLPRGVILQGIEEDRRLRISEVVVLEPPLPAGSPLPLATDLFSRLNPRLYGLEERAKLSLAADQLRLSCDPGERPAGVVLRNDGARLPEGIEAGLAFAYAADATFGVGYADGQRHSLNDPYPLGQLAGSSEQVQPAEAMFPLPAPDPRDYPSGAQPGFALTLMCPALGGKLELSSLQLGVSQAERPSRSIWIWRPAEWLESAEALLAELQALSTPVVYVSVPMANDRVAQADALAQFIGAAGERGIEVWAVEGDPHAVLPEGQAAFEQRARALMRFNATQPLLRRLAGVQYDIEPYLLPDFALHTSDWLQAYVQTIARLDATLEIPLEVAVPFWWSALEVDGQPLLDLLAPHVQSLNVMNYRTDPEQLQLFAEPFLAWGVAQNVDVRIALEAGPIRDEVRWHFRADEAGTLWHLQLAGEDLLLLFAVPTVLDAGAGYRFVRQSEFQGSRLTFRGDRARMDQVMGQLESLWSAWPSFAGLALHEYRLQGE